MAAERRGFVAVLAFLWTLAVLAGNRPMAWSQAPDDDTAPARHRMVEQIRVRGVTDVGVLAALEAVPRHLFVPADERGKAYADHPLPIGGGQTISQPYMVALMTSLLDLRPGARVLEIGTGSGYQAAILSRVAGEVYTIEILKPLAERARRTLTDLGCRNVHVRTGDGFQGWPNAAPFDGIIVTAAPPSIPDPLLEQLKVGGRLVIPVGDRDALQNLQVLTKRADGGFDRSSVMPVRFVPMTGEAQRREK
ncbi:MAG TPA: protein-L-isoaspartate(D-aspartate) O-methyltransferase [Thermoanaerobaculia bacterium]|jgi:protein-L-isoaspartate(D-aspartate) O-methyltransferase|nr:protein-L-isoaspartate(D-aspartate) O-methyltransferase [Thermoanaerobaculia bacterium]